MKFHFFHRWTRWGAPKILSGRIVQYRCCEICAKIQTQPTNV